MKRNKFNSGMDSDLQPNILPETEHKYMENMKPRIIATLTDDQVQLLEENASRIDDNYFIPYWFKRIEGNRFELFPLGQLPDEMRAEIEEVRRQCDRLSLMYEQGEHPLIKHTEHK